MILHACHHPPPQAYTAETDGTLSKGISLGFSGLYLLPPLNTARESQDSAAVTENYLWWEICEGERVQGEEGEGGKKDLALNIYTFTLLWTQFATFGPRSIIERKDGK